MEYLNDKPTAIIRKASSIHNFEFNLIRHPANFITYLTGLLIQFTLLLFQITTLGPTLVGNTLEDGFRNAVAPSPRSPDTQHLFWDGGIYSVLGLCLHFSTYMQRSPEELKEEKRTKKKKKTKPTNPKQKNRFITVNACAHQLKQQLPTRLPDTSFPPEKHPKIILYGVWGIYIRALHTSPKSILIKPSSAVHDTSGQDRNQKRSHASNCSCNTFRAKEVSSLKAEPFTPNHTQKQRIQLPKASPASTCILLPTASDSRIPASLPALPALSSCSDMAAFTQSTSGVSSED